MTKGYEAFDEFDLLADDSFLRWLDGYQESGHWDQWLKARPGRQALVERAVRVRGLVQGFDKYLPDATAKASVWGKILHDLPPGFKGATRTGSWLPLKYAATLILALLLGGGIYLWGKRKVQVSTGPVTREVRLPDGSVVTLNRNSSLSYPERMAIPREIWLEGEAYLEVNDKKDTAGQAIPFLVHFGGWTVEVLGTSFTIRHSDSLSAVILNEGLVRVKGEDAEVMLLPGEMLRMDKEGYRKQQVDPDLFNAWKEGIFRFDQTGLEEIGNLISHYYGYKVRVPDQQDLKYKTMSGEVAADSLGSLLKAMRIIMGVKAVFMKDSLLIQAE